MVCMIGVSKKVYRGGKEGIRFYPLAVERYEADVFLPV